MDHQEYKEMLALEALGALEEQDARALRTHLATCAECQAELAELRDAAATLAYTVAPVQPPDELRALILERINVRGGAGQVAATREADPASVEDKPAAPSSNVLPLPLGSQRGGRTFVVNKSTFVFGALAAAVILAALALPLVLLWNQNNRMRRELARLSANLNESQTMLASTTERLRASQEELAGTPARIEEPLQPTKPRAAPPAEESARSEAGAELARLSARNDELAADLARSAIRNDTLRAEIARLSTRNGELQTELAQVSNRSSEVQAELARIQKLLGETQTQIASVSTRNTNLQAEVARLSTRNGELQTEVARLTERGNALQAEIGRGREVDEILTAPGARAVALAGTKVAPGARAGVVYDQRTGNVLLTTYDLPPAPVGKAYQLWLLVGSKPSSVSVFTPDARGRTVLRGQVSGGGSRASAFAVSLEPAGGSSAPTGDIYLLGKVS